MRPFTVPHQFAILLICFVLFAAMHLPALALSLPVEGLQLMLDDVTNDRERREVIDLGEDLHRELSDEVDALQRARDNSPGYLLYDADGRLLNVSREEALELAGPLTTNLVAGSNYNAYILALLNRAEDGGDMENIYARAVLGILRSREDEKNNYESYLDLITEALEEGLENADARNRQALDQEIEDVFADRTAISGIVAAANAMWGDIVPAAPEAPEGFMNEAGFYLVQLTGNGWHKLGANRATRIIGFENIVVESTDEVTEPHLGTWYWRVPLGYDLHEFERARQEEARAASQANCSRRNPLGPRDPAPEIWIDGPHYEIAQGPIATWNEARLLRGNPRLPNNDPQGPHFWDHDRDFTYEDLDPTCDRYGVSLVD